MILRGWHIERFGLFRDSRVEGLGDGITVVHGPNEAGKSTLLAFIRGVLFGFPDRRSKSRLPLYVPRDGGHPSGRLFIESRGRAYTVARGGSRRNALTVSDAEGAELPEGELTRILGGADATLFRNVFGFSLYELQELETLTETEVRDRIFSGAVAGAGRSARQAAQALDGDAKALYHPDGRARKNRVAELLGELRDIDAELTAARRQAETYPAMQAAEADAAAEVQRLRESVTALRQRRDRLQALLRLWEPWCAREAALAELEAGGQARFDRQREIRPAPEVLDLGRRCDELVRNVELQRQRLGKLGSLQGALEQTQAALDDALETLGPDWDEERIAGFRLSIPTTEEVRAWERGLNEAEARVAQATAAREAAARQHREAAQAAEARQGDLEAFGPPPPEPDALHERQRRLEGLRAQVDELARAGQAVDHAESLRDERQRRLDEVMQEQPGRGGYLLALVLAVAGVAVSGALTVTAGEPLVAAAGLLLVALAIPVALHTRRQRQQAEARIRTARKALEQADDKTTEARDAHDRLRAEIAEAAEDLDLPAAPLPADIAAARAELDHGRERRRDWEARKQRLADAVKAREKAEADLEAAQRTEDEAITARDAAARDWRAWKEGHGFPTTLSPQGVLDFAAQVDAARKRLSDKRTQTLELAGLREDVADWEKAARAVLRRRGASGEETGEALILAFNEAAAAVRAEAEAYRKIAATEDALAREGGHDPGRVAALRATLDAGDAEAWRQEQAEVAERLETEETALEEAIRQHQDAGKQREAVEQSTRIAELELRRNTLAAEIAACHRRWQVLTLAQRLVLDTLEAFERERQPQVFASAGTVLARVTGGRYTGIVQDEAGSGFYVLDGDNRRISPIDLSRGTREQLYLAVRLGLVEEFARRGTALPLVMDEILVNSDPDRMQALARELHAFADRHQILLFTCHPFVVDVMKAVGGNINVLPVDALKEGLTTAAE